MIGLGLGKDLPYRDLVLTSDDGSVVRCDDLRLKVLLNRLAMLRKAFGVGHDDEVPVPPKSERTERRNEHGDKIGHLETYSSLIKGNRGRSE